MTRESQGLPVEMFQKCNENWKSAGLSVQMPKDSIIKRIISVYLNSKIFVSFCITIYLSIIMIYLTQPLLLATINISIKYERKIVSSVIGVKVKR